MKRLIMAFLGLYKVLGLLAARKGTKMTTNEVYSYCSIGFCVFSLIFAGYVYHLFSHHHTLDKGCFSYR